MIIMDEPTSALDPIIEKKFFDLIDKIAKEKIVIIVTHDLDIIKKYDVHCLTIKDGKINQVQKNNKIYIFTAQKYVCTILRISLKKLSIKLFRVVKVLDASYRAELILIN